MRYVSRWAPAAMVGGLVVAAGAALPSQARADARVPVAPATHSQGSVPVTHALATGETASATTELVRHRRGFRGRGFGFRGRGPGGHAGEGGGR
jgi:hypothetical protein